MASAKRPRSGRRTREPETGTENPASGRTGQGRQQTRTPVTLCAAGLEQPDRPVPPPRTEQATQRRWSSLHPGELDTAARGTMQVTGGVRWPVPSSRHSHRQLQALLFPFNHVNVTRLPTHPDEPREGHVGRSLTRLSLVALGGLPGTISLPGRGSAAPGTISLPGRRPVAVGRQVRAWEGGAIGHTPRGVGVSRRGLPWWRSGWASGLPPPQPGPQPEAQSSAST